MEEYDKTGLPLDFLSFLMNITVPGHCINRRPNHFIELLTTRGTWNELMSPFWLRGWQTRLMGSSMDGLCVPESTPYYQDLQYNIQCNMGLHSKEPEVHTDFDIWLWRADLPVGFMPTSAPLIADGSDCSPGYFIVKMNQTDSAKEIVSKYINIGEKKGYDIVFYFQTSDKILKNINGPAITFHFPKKSQPPIDHVHVLLCEEWPELARRWETRQRRGGWPSSDSISDLKKLGCDFAQASSHDSKNPEIEWRIGFSLIEQKLCLSFTTVQKQCFLIAKVIMKNNLKSCEGYSTYLLKNTMFWMMEDTPASDWEGENALARYLMLLLDTFQSYLEKGNLPHYFIEKRNLIGHIHNEVCKEMIEKTYDVRSSLHVQLLEHCSSFCPLGLKYSYYKDICLYIFRFLPQMYAHPGVYESGMKQEILRTMALSLAIENRIEVMVNTLKQYGHLLDPLADRHSFIHGDEKDWIFTKVDAIFIHTPVPMMKFLSPRLSGMLYLYYYLIHKDKSLLKFACNYFRNALDNYRPIIFWEMGDLAKPTVHVFDVLAKKAMGDYENASRIISFVSSNEEWLQVEFLLEIPFEFCGLLDTLMLLEYWDAIFHVSVNDITIFMKVQLLVLMNRFDEAESLMEIWSNQAPSFWPSQQPEKYSPERRLLAGLGYVWVSNFRQAAVLIESMKGSCTGIDTLCEIIGALSGMAKS